MALAAAGQMRLLSREARWQARGLHQGSCCSEIGTLIMALAMLRNGVSRRTHRVDGASSARRSSLAYTTLYTFVGSDFFVLEIAVPGGVCSCGRLVCAVVGTGRLVALGRKTGDAGESVRRVTFAILSPLPVGLPRDSD